MNQCFNTRGDMCELYTTNWQSRAAVTPLAIEEYHDWMPIMERSAFLMLTYKIKPISIKVPIRCCYSWRIRIGDNRHKHMVGKDGVTITGTKLWPQLVPNMRCKPERAGPHPSIQKVHEADDDDIDAVEADEADEEVIQTASELNTSITMHLGWRTSYRKSCPEDYNAQEERVRKVLRKNAMC